VPEFDQRLFGEDYLYFWAPLLGDERTEEEVDTVWRVLELEPGMEVLDLACGHGRIGNRLAARGARVTGLDSSRLFIERAREDAVARGVDVEYVEGDMRSLQWSDRFDCVLNWFTAFGYFEDDELRRVLAEVRRALRPGGRFLLEHLNLASLFPRFRTQSVTERDGNFLLELRELDAVGGRILSEYVVVRDGVTRRYPIFVRLLWPPELRDWLLGAGFSSVDFLGPEGEPLTRESRRLLAVARV
jgi:SAM-dependent methyltransferase